jgi:hypothetical protein
MIPGITGSLIANAFLTEVLLPEFLRGGDSESQRAISRLRRWWRRSERLLGPASSARAILDIAVLPLVELLGYEVRQLQPHSGGFIGTLGRTEEQPVVLTTTTWNHDLGVAWRDTVRAGRVTGASWGLVCSGRTARVVDASRTWSRRIIDFDLSTSLADERGALAFWALCRAASLLPVQGGSGLREIVQRSDEHGLAVCSTLGDGVLDALSALLTSLEEGKGAKSLRLSNRDAFEQSLTIVYRLLFLLFAEARALVPTWHHVYRDAYTIEALCKRSLTRRQPRGLWAALQAISRLAHAGCQAGDLIVTAFNGRLFAPIHTPLAERTRVRDEVVARAVVSLATSRGPGGRRRISYADLGVEQLGAVYERVLDYEPSAAAGPIVLTRTSCERKASGSFYTPRSMTDFLVRRALSPLVEGQSVERILSLRIVDPAMGSGAFLVAACRYLAAAAERALSDDGEWMADTNNGARTAELRRLVAQRCLYGVDLNPMAVQLARLSLWLTTLARDRPLTFLDHHLAAGDSLLGASFDDLARQFPGRRRRPSSIDPTLPLFGDETAEHLAKRVLPDRFRLARDPDDSPAAVRDKERTLARLVMAGTPLSRWKGAADFWCAGWFRPAGVLSPGVYADVVGSLLDQRAALTERHRDALVAESGDLAQRYRFFHWPLEFPEIFFDEAGRCRPDGGFDAVIGNPPWDVLRADTGNRQTRDHARRDRDARLRFFRDAGIYQSQGRGHPNRYQLFLERALQLTRSGGRVGLILPSGLATDQGSSSLRRTLLDSVDVDRLIGFDNRRSIFPIHRDVKFLLLTGTKGSRTDRLTCAFGRSDAEWLDQLPDAPADDPPAARPIVLSRTLLETWDRDHLAFPLLPRSIDLEILAHASERVLRLGDATGWGATFGRELNATDDKEHFVARHGNTPRKHGDTETRHANTEARRGNTESRRRQTNGGQLLTVVEGKHVEPFRLLKDASTVGILRSSAAALLDPDRTFGRRRLAYRDVASSTNRLTLIAAILPADTVSTHTLFCLKTRLSDSSQYCLLALLNSLVANYLVRLQVTTHVTTALMARLPVPRPAGDDWQFRALATLARSLEKTGISDNHSYARMNAIVADLYQLSAAQYEHVLGTFPLLPESLRVACSDAYKEATGHGSTESRSRGD